jgi:putative 4-mercaptohistidine N1-methyltranferase
MIKKILLSRSAADNRLTASMSRYHSDMALSQYADLHFGAERFGVANFHRELVGRCVNQLEPEKRRRALDLGCALGRASFELAKSFDAVIAVDLSERFISVAKQFQAEGTYCYQQMEEGELLSTRCVHLTDFGFSEACHKIKFMQGNALELNEDMGKFDLILAANLIDRLPDPEQFLAGVHQYMISDGVLVIASPYDWQERFTPKPKWLGGCYRAGLPMTSLEGISRQLKPRFSMIGKPYNLEFIVCENSRRYCHGISEVTCWRYRS